MWPLNILLISLAAVLTQRLWRAEWLRMQWVRWPIALLIGASFVLHPLRQLRLRANAGRPIHELEEQVAATGITHTRIASNGDYGGSYLIAYRLRAQYFGQTKAPTGATIEQQLLANDIEYYFVWQGARIDSPVLEKLYHFSACGTILDIYAVRKPRAAAS